MVTEDLGQRFARVYAIRAPLLLNSAILLERLRLRLRLLSLRLHVIWPLTLTEGCDLSSRAKGLRRMRAASIRLQQFDVPANLTQFIPQGAAFTIGDVRVTWKLVFALAIIVPALVVPSIVTTW